MADLFARTATEPPARHFMPTLLVAALDAARREATRPLPPPPPSIEPLLAEARQGGWADGLAEGLRRAADTQQAAAARAAEVAVEALRHGHDAAREAAGAVAQDLARLVIAMLDAALPGLAADHAAPLAAAFARRVAPVLEVTPEARLLVPPGLGDAVRALLGASVIAVEEDASLPPGDARATWRGGGAALDLAMRRQAIGRVLESSGLGPKE
ncbi:hypothetical protein AAFN86_15695 [Roseomonas sp. CAU 1739]|uniref:hypothetical protein n=1 Tax=Roseomonas sp. CAU 1739 TaxID=3140364 RepID=UPI00325BDAAD